MDVTKSEDVAAALRQTKEQFGRLDAVVNCAGIGVAFKVYNFNKDRAHTQEDFVKVQLLLLPPTPPPTLSLPPPRCNW